MNWAAWGPTIIAVISAIFIAGQVSGRIKGQEKTLVLHNTRLNGHDEDIKALAIKAAKSEGWMEGYRANPNHPKDE